MEVGAGIAFEIDGGIVEVGGGGGGNSPAPGIPGDGVDTDGVGCGGGGGGGAVVGGRGGAARLGAAGGTEGAGGAGGAGGASGAAGIEVCENLAGARVRGGGGGLGLALKLGGLAGGGAGGRGFVVRGPGRGGTGTDGLGGLGAVAVGGRGAGGRNDGAEPGGGGGRTVGADRAGEGVPLTDRSFGRPAAKMSPMPTGGPPGATGGRGGRACMGEGPPPPEGAVPDVFPATVGADRSFVCTFFRVLPFLIASCSAASMVNSVTSGSGAQCLLRSRVMPTGMGPRLGSVRSRRGRNLVVGFFAGLNIPSRRAMRDTWST